MYSPLPFRAIIPRMTFDPPVKSGGSKVIHKFLHGRKESLGMRLFVYTLYMYLDSLKAE